MGSVRPSQRTDRARGALLRVMSLLLGLALALGALPHLAAGHAPSHEAQVSAPAHHHPAQHGGSGVQSGVELCAGLLACFAALPASTPAAIEKSPPQSPQAPLLETRRPDPMPQRLLRPPRSLPRL